MRLLLVCLVLVVLARASPITRLTELLLRAFKPSAVQTNDPADEHADFDPEAIICSLCTINNGGCDPNARCTCTTREVNGQTRPVPSCECLPGWTMVGTQCDNAGASCTDDNQCWPLNFCYKGTIQTGCRSTATGTCRKSRCATNPAYCATGEGKGEGDRAGLPVGMRTCTPSGSNQAKCLLTRVAGDCMTCECAQSNGLCRKWGGLTCKATNGTCEPCSNGDRCDINGNCVCGPSQRLCPSGGLCRSGQCCSLGACSTTDNCCGSDQCVAGVCRTLDATCTNSDCYNRGTASGLVPTCTCVCQSGWMGSNCQTAVTCSQATLALTVSHTSTCMTFPVAFQVSCTQSCSAGYYGGSGPRQCTGLNIWTGSNPTCTACTPTCTSGVSYETQACTPSANRVCSACATACTSGSQYQTQACTPTQNRLCSTCAAACTTGSQYEAMPCNGVSNRQCASCRSACTAGSQYETHACDGVADRTCGSCAPACAAGFSETQACDGVHDRVCAACASSLNCATYSTGCSCASCVAGYDLNGVSCSNACASSLHCLGYSTGCNCAACVAGYLYNSGSCSASCTNPSCTGYSTGCTCNACLPGKQLNGANCDDCPYSNQCSVYSSGCTCTTCIDNYEPVGGNCQGCNIMNCFGAYAPGGGACVCTTCIAGYTGPSCSACPGAGCDLYSSGCSCQTCAANYGLSGGSCTACTVAQCTAYTANTCSCTTCNPGYDGPSCAACPGVGCDSYSSGCSCQTCATNYGLTGSSCTACGVPQCTAYTPNTCSCSTCNPGYAGASCTACDVNCATFSTGCTCTACNNGFALDMITGICTACGVSNCNTYSAGTCTCTSCAAGYQGASCTACGVTGCSAYSSGCMCSACTAGNDILAITPCSPCSASLQCNGYSSGCQCSGCQTGYTLGSGGVCGACPVSGCVSFSSGCTCSNCGNGREFIGSDCQACTNTGCSSYSAPGCTGTCSGCSAGYTLSGSTCNACSGTVCTATELYVADDCNSGSDGCFDCTTITGCLGCSSKAVCTQCAGAFYLSGTTCTACSLTNCAAGYYYDSSLCVNADSGCRECAVNCDACTSGMSSSCTNCAAGYRLLNHPTAGECEACTVTNCGVCDAGAAVCTECAEGTRFVDASTCEDCTYGCATCPTASATCTTCIVGYVHNPMGDVCTACPQRCSVCSVDAEVCSACFDGSYLAQDVSNGNNNRCFQCSSIPQNAGGVTCTDATDSQTSSCQTDYWLDNGHMDACQACDVCMGTTVEVSPCYTANRICQEPAAPPSILDHGSNNDPSGGTWEFEWTTTMNGCTDPQMQFFIERMSGSTVLSSDAITISDVTLCGTNSGLATYYNGHCSFPLPSSNCDSSCEWRLRIVVQCGLLSNEGFSEQKSRVCFPLDSMVMLDNGRSVMLEQLQPGDRVASVNAAGLLEFGTFYFWLHKSTKAVTVFDEIQHECPAGQHASSCSIRLTTTHMLHFIPATLANSSWSAADWAPLVRIGRANEVHVGDYVLVLRGSAFEPALVTGVLRDGVKRVGFAAPFISTGTVVIDGVAASVFAAGKPQAEMQAAYAPMHVIYEHLLLPLVQWDMPSESDGTFVAALKHILPFHEWSQEDGWHWYARTRVFLRDLFDPLKQTTHANVAELEDYQPGENLAWAGLRWVMRRTVDAVVWLAFNVMRPLLVTLQPTLGFYAK